jgi:hypothetical protein
MIAVQWQHGARDPLVRRHVTPERYTGAKFETNYNVNAHRVWVLVSARSRNLRQEEPLSVSSAWEGRRFAGGSHMIALYNLQDVIFNFET